MLASSSSQPGALPSPHTSLVGRDREIESLCALLRDPTVRLLTLTGPGGVGKTRLALATTNALETCFPDGVHVVSLAPITDPDLVAPTIAIALSIEDLAGQSPLEALTTSLRDRRALLVLDNFEQVIDAATVVAELVHACPDLTILTTSRVPLHLSSERELPVAPLDLPDATRELDVDGALEHAAVALFAERARSARADFRLTASNVAAVAEICRRLDGLPLAIELAAARIKLMAPADILPRLRQRLTILTGGFRDVPARQRTMRDAIAWSYDLLSGDDQRLFRQLAVFAGGWSLDGAEAVCDANLDILEGLGRLLDSSLIRRAERPRGAARFTMLETIREFGLEQVAASATREQTRLRHEAYVLRLADEAGDGLMGQDQIGVLEKLDGEIDNVRAVLTGLLARGDGDAALRLVVTVEEYWLLRFHVDEMRDWLTRALAASADAPVSLRARAHNILGHVARNQGDYVSAENEHRQAIAFYRQAGDHDGLTAVTGELAWMALYHGQYGRANELFEQALSLARTLENKALLADALSGMAVGLSVDGEYDVSICMCEESLAIWRDLGASSAISQVLFYLGYFWLWRGDVEQAERVAQEALLVAQLVDHFDVAGTQELLGYIALERDDVGRADALFRDAVSATVTQWMFMTLAECLEGLAGVCGRRGQPVRGATLLGSAEAIREQFESPVPPPRRDRYDRTLLSIRDHLEASALDRAWARGRAMSRQEAINYALGNEDVPAAPAEATNAGGPSDAAGLTSREVDVLRLIARGHTDKEVADVLYVSPRTVSTHLTSIYAKLDVSTRTAAAAWAIRHGIAAEE